MIELLGLGEYLVYLGAVLGLEFLGGRFLTWLSFLAAEMERHRDESPDD